MLHVREIGDEEDETAGEENGSACHGKRQKEASRVVHEGSDHRPDCEAKVERGVAPGLYGGLSVREPGHQDGEVGGPCCCCSHSLEEADQVGEEEEGAPVDDEPRWEDRLHPPY